MTDHSLVSVLEPPEQASKMNMQTFVILIAVIAIVGAFASYVSKTLGKPEGAAALPAQPASEAPGIDAGAPIPPGQ